MRLTRLDICKAIAIILMVIGHTETQPLQRWLQEFHMPLFFIAAGFCFNPRYLNDEAAYLKRRIKGLYWPFVKWSLVFLCLHNLWFRIGLLNEQYGTYRGGVTHPFHSFREFWQHVWSVVFNMSGYDVFLTGAFWFFRALLLASVGYLVLHKLLLHVKPLRQRPLLLTSSVAAVGLGLALWKCGMGLRVTGVPQGGYRDLMGLFFFAVGYAFRLRPRWLEGRWPVALACFAVVTLFACYLPGGMPAATTWDKCLRLPVPAVAGFVMTWWVAGRIEASATALRSFLRYCGQHTLQIYVFHIISFKAVSALKILYYDLPWGHIGSHMVVHYAKDDLFWIPYTIAGVGLPLLWMWCYERLRQRRLAAKGQTA